MRKLGVVFAGALLGFMFAATTAAASPRMSVSFSADDTSSAHWLPGQAGVVLTVGNDPGAWAVITVHHFSTYAPPDTQEPTFTTDDYNAGSPRWYIQFADGKYLFGYPAQYGTGTVWQVIGATSTAYTVSWAEARSDVGADSNPVTGVFIVADADQAAGTTDTIHAMQYFGTTLAS